MTEFVALKFMSEINHGAIFDEKHVVYHENLKQIWLCELAQDDGLPLGTNRSAFVFIESHTNTPKCDPWQTRAL